jgi:hypothetical protein
MALAASTLGWRPSRRRTHPEATLRSIRFEPADVTVEGYPTRKVTPMPVDVLIVNIAVLFAVLEADLGRRTISRFRILRPLFLAAGIIPLFIKHPATAGTGEVLEIVLTALGVILGVAAAGGLMKVSFDETSQRVVSSAGVAYGAFWTFVIGARVLFTYGANHWYSAQLVHWMSSNGVSVDALTDALIFMALAMTVTRTIRLAIGRAQVRRPSAHQLAV